MLIRFLIYFFIILVLLVPNNLASAQQDQETPVYIVQSGDTLSIIALRFGISTQKLIAANGISDPNALAVGTELTIPGLEGIKGILVSEIVPFGATLQGFSISHHISQNDLSRLNRITSPSEFFAGNNLIVPEKITSDSPQLFNITNHSNSLLDLAIKENVNPWTITYTNRSLNEWNFSPGIELYLPPNSRNSNVDSQSSNRYNISVDPLPLSQGVLCRITIQSSQPVALTGSLVDKQISFHKLNLDEQIAYIGIPLNIEPGISRIVVKGQYPDGGDFTIDQALLISKSGFAEDPPLIVDPVTINPDTIKQEDEIVLAITSQVTPDRLWKENFIYPIDDPCIRAQFGNQRVYNNSYDSFHTGIDFGVCAQNLNVYADAPGTVVYTGSQVIRGNAIIIDHGWGVYSGFWHQSEIKVNVGDRVEAGQLIGTVGTTGRSTGPHLHWEIRVNGVPVNPIDWINASYP